MGGRPGAPHRVGGQMRSASAGILLIGLWVACDSPDDVEPLLPQRSCSQVECIKDMDCAANLFCNAELGACVECLLDRHCDGNPQGSRCGDSGTCQCGSDRECSAPLGLCRSTGCVCSEDTACAGSGAQRCELGVCIACGGDGDCRGDEFGSACFEGGGVDAYCGCADDRDCEGSTPRCDAALGRCVCAMDDDCVDHGAGATCVSGECLPCLSAEQCRAAGLGQYCDTSTHTCYACESDADCRKLGTGTRCVGRACACDDAADCTAKAAEGMQWICD